MRKLLLIFLLVCYQAEAMAQLKTSFNAGMFGYEAPTSPQKQDILLSDFRYEPAGSASTSFLDIPRTKAGAAFVASAILPGSGQAANGKWVRAGVYLAAEVAGIIFHIDQNNKARKQEKAYEQYTHQNWSVVAYSQWLVQYSQSYNLNNDWEQLAASVNGQQPDWDNTTRDWNKVNLALLHSVERKTSYLFDDPAGCLPETCRRASTFSHTLPEYGSQQYYELISKYYQYQPGWRDYYNTAINTQSSSYNPNHVLAFMSSGQHLPSTLFYIGRDRAQEFNDTYRLAGNILKLLIVNHVVSAFDAFFTVQLKNSRLETSASLLSYEQLSFSWHF